MTRSALRILAAGACFAIRITAATPANPYPLSPSNPTDVSECDAYQQRIGEINRYYNEAHDACLKANEKAPAVPGSGPGAICSKAACQSLHTIVYGHAANQAQEALNACREAVSAYRQQLQAEQAAIQRQTQALDRAGDELATQAGQNEQQAATARSITDQLRQQAALDAAVRPSLSGNQLASLDAARATLEQIKSKYDIDASPVLSLNTSHSGGLLSAFKDKVFDLAMDALKASGPSGKQVARVVENVRLLKTQWDNFKTVADQDAKIDDRLDALGAIAKTANSIVSPSNFLFPGLLNYGIITPYKGVFSALDVALAAEYSPEAAAELERIGTPYDVSRYYPVLDLKNWPRYVTIAHVPLDQFLAALGIGAQ